MILRSAIALTVALGVAPAMNASAQEKDVTRFGPTYEIVEPDMLEDILARMQEKQDSGEALRIQQEAADRAKARLLNPAPVEGITTARKKRVFTYDPTVVAHENILGPDGRILIPRGTRANPLEISDFGDPMFFFDARDPKQVKKAQALIKEYKGGIMPVLTGGSFVDLMKKWNRRVWYDQTGFITKKLGIRHVPALVTQEGNLLRIEEFVP